MKWFPTALAVILAVALVGCKGGSPNSPAASKSASGGGSGSGVPATTIEPCAVLQTGEIQTDLGKSVSGVGVPNALAGSGRGCTWNLSSGGQFRVIFDTVNGSNSFHIPGGLAVPGLGDHAVYEAVPGMGMLVVYRQPHTALSVNEALPTSGGSAAQEQGLVSLAKIVLGRLP